MHQRSTVLYSRWIDCVLDSVSRTTDWWCTRKQRLPLRQVGSKRLELGVFVRAGMNARRTKSLRAVVVFFFAELGASQLTTTVTPGPPPSLVVQAPSPPAPMTAAHRAVLVDIKASNPDAVGALPNWDLANEPCTSPWEGVACDADGRVKSLCAPTPPFSPHRSAFAATAQQRVCDSGTCSAVVSRRFRPALASSRSSRT